MPAVRCALSGPTLSVLFAALLLTACVSGPTGPTARADVEPTAGNAVQGWVQFAQQGRTVNVTAEVRGLTPNSEHGFHVHEKGDCSAPDATSAGGHFNPTDQPHGHHGQSRRHAGDMPSLKADAAGVARLDWQTNLLTVGSGATNVVGRGVIVHRDPDDFTTQPTGNSGARVACGVVKAR
jgi:superoxide dismutase, Cu-Zn family